MLCEYWQEFSLDLPAIHFLFFLLSSCGTVFLSGFEYRDCFIPKKAGRLVFETRLSLLQMTTERRVYNSFVV